MVSALSATSRVATAQSQATTSANCWGESFGYDRYGNLTGITTTQCTAPMLSLSVTNKNRIANPAFTYDDAGNLTADGMYSYTWDGENHLTSVNGVSYTYDGDGRRVKKSSGTLYWYGLKGEVLEETDLAGNWVYDYAYFNGQRVGRRDPAGNIASYFTDPLGSARVVAGPSGALAESDYYPFGGERVIASTLAPGNKYQFTGMERDSESGLDHTLYRQYAWNLSRWLSPDPLHGTPANPQSWNRYAYVLNNATNLIDPLGLQCRPGSPNYENDCQPVANTGSGPGASPIIPLGPGQCTEVIVDGFGRGTVCAGPNGTNTVTSANPRSPGFRACVKTSCLFACSSTSGWFSREFSTFAPFPGWN